MSHRPLLRLSTAAAALALAVPVLALAGAPAQAAARITIANDRGDNQADVTYQTPLKIRGTGFQSIQGGFGGVYLMFGWVKPGSSWQPSKGGVTGTDYKYIPDAENAKNKGFLKFIAFPGSSTESEAQAVLEADGSFEVALTIPGPVFQSADRDGTVSEVDCRKVTCGVITIGAHGVKNARNETFTPVPFGTVYAAEQAEDETGTGDGATPTDPSPTGQSSTQPTPQPASQSAAIPTSGATATSPAPKASATAKPAKPALNTDRPTARAGSALAFTGTGFEPGEQVLAILDDGVAALGPMIAGRSGEVAGLLPLPVDLRVGTHQLRLTGAASGAAPSERFPVAAASSPPTPASATSSEDAGGRSTSQLFLAFSAAAFLVAALSVALSRTRRRGRIRLTPATGGAS